MAAWRLMLKRCCDPTDPGYANYGARGIGVCASWHASFDAFLADMGRRPSSAHSLDRRDNNGSYDGVNCRWATRTEQARNKRDNVRIEFNGLTRTAVEWSLITGLSQSAIIRRLKRGAVEKVLTKRSERPKAVK